MNQLDGRTIRTAMWGALLIWIGLMMIIDEPAGLASIGAGIILLTAALFRRAMGRRAGMVLSITAVLLIALGIADLGGDDRGIPLLATALIAIGAMIIVRVFSARRFIERTRNGITIHLSDERDRRTNGT